MIDPDLEAYDAALEAQILYSPLFMGLAERVNGLSLSLIANRNQSAKCNHRPMTTTASNKSVTLLILLCVYVMKWFWR
jgi:hypothetical protein